MNEKKILNKSNPDAFRGYEEPIGTLIDLHIEKDTPRGRLAIAFFQKEMFKYFGEVASEQCGWGISFREWLEIYGWKGINYSTFERVKALEE